MPRTDLDVRMGGRQHVGSVRPKSFSDYGDMKYELSSVARASALHTSCFSRKCAMHAPFMNSTSVMSRLATISTNDKPYTVQST